MYFKNKTTQITWHITNQAHQSRLQKDTNYVHISDHKESEMPVSRSSDVLDDNTDYTELSWNDLRSLATEEGINTHGKKRTEIEEELEKLGEVDVTE